MNSSLIGMATNSNDRYSLILFTVLGSRCLATMQNYGDLMQVPTEALARNTLTKLAKYTPILNEFSACSMCIIDKETNALMYRVFYRSKEVHMEDAKQAFIFNLLLKLESIYLRSSKAHATVSSRIATRYVYTKVNLLSLPLHYRKQLDMYVADGLDVPAMLRKIVEASADHNITKLAAM